MEKKYILTDEIREFNGKILHRIQAVRDFGKIRTGDLGDWIEKEGNLSHEGDCWVCNDAQVYDNARVGANALVGDDAHVFGNALIYGNAWVYDNAHIYGNTRIYGNARVLNNANVRGNTTLANNAYITDTNDCITMGPIGSMDNYITFYLTEDKNIMVKIDYFNCTTEEFIKIISYETNNKYKN